MQLLMINIKRINIDNVMIIFDNSGRCVCYDLHDPVCGCESIMSSVGLEYRCRTYSNSSCARCEGVYALRPGPC